MWGIQKDDYYLGETDDKNYKQHVVTFDYVSVKEDASLADIGYHNLFKPGYPDIPVNFSADQRYDKYKVEYDIVAGNKTEYSDPEHPIYELVKANETRKYVGAASEVMVGRMKIPPDRMKEWGQMKVSGQTNLIVYEEVIYSFDIYRSCIMRAGNRYAIQ